MIVYAGLKGNPTFAFSTKQTFTDSSSGKSFSPKLGKREG